jgi:hypothetical protein
VTDAQVIDAQAIAAAVQAVAAVLVAILTWQLIVATNAYVKTTRETGPGVTGATGGAA